MSTIKCIIRPFVVIVALVAALLGIASTSEAREATPAPLTAHRLTNPSGDYLSPRVQVTTSKSYSFKQLGYALDDSDIFVPVIKGRIEGGSTVTYRLPHFQCQEGEVFNLYGITLKGRTVLVRDSRGNVIDYMNGRVCLTAHAKGVNATTCGPDQDKQYKVLATVHEGTMGKWATTFRLALTSGKFLKSRAWTNGTNNQREYYFKLSSPTDKIDLAHLGRSSGFISPSLGSYWTAKVSVQCGYDDSAVAQSLQ